MATILTPKKMALTKLPSSETALYTTPTGKKALIHNIVLHNTDGSTAYTPSIFIYDGTSSYRIWCASLAANNTVIIDFGNSGLLLEAGSAIRGLAGTADKITISISGFERA